MKHKTIPQVRQEMREALKTKHTKAELLGLIEGWERQLYKRYFGRASSVSKPATKASEMRAINLAATYPDAPQHIIAQHLAQNPGRVSEALHGKRGK